jgi:E3 ubiquitin-protein ligase synoviolin
MRLALFGVVSTVLTIYTLINAYIQRGQFFSTCIYISHSNASILVLFSMAIYVFIVVCKIIQKIFFGPLRAIEIEHLYERSWYAVTELCLALSVFRGEFSAKFALLLTVLIIMKIFHWLMQDRIDFMEQGINQSWLFHIRICSVIIILLLLDTILLTWTLDYTLKFGISMVIVLGFEYTILWSNALTGLLKYILHSIDLRRENPWENKSMYIFYIDLVREFFVLVCYVIFFAVIVHRYGLPLHLIRDLYVTFRSFIQHCRDLIHYKKATRNMNERYPNATLEDLTENDNICIICREEMTIQEDNNSSDVPKKLRCGHIFHLRCLKSWLERQQSCPTCRCSLLETNPVNNNNNNRNAQPQPQANAAPAAAEQPQQQQNNQASTNPTTNTTENNNNNNISTGTTSSTTQRSVPHVFANTSSSNSFSLPIIPKQTSNMALLNDLLNNNKNNTNKDSVIPIMLTPIASLGPNSDTSIPPIESLSDEKLREIEGSLRQNVIARIKTISEINQQLNGIVNQLNQVLSYMPDSQLNSNNTNTASTSSSPNDNKKDKENNNSDNKNNSSVEPVESNTNSQSPQSFESTDRSIINDEDTTSSPSKGKEAIETAEISTENKTTATTTTNDSLNNEIKPETVEN